MDHLLGVLLLLLWSSGLQAEGIHTSAGAQCETTEKADIVLLVDDTDSISQQDLKIIKCCITHIVNAFSIGPERVQIGLTQFSNHPWTQWHLNTHQIKQSLLEATDKLQRYGRGTSTGAALKHILHNNFKPHVGMRTDSKKIAILITDGLSQDNVTVPSQDLRDTGIEIYAVGVKNAYEEQLKVIASDPKDVHVYYVEKFEFLENIINDLIINVCNSTNSLGSVRLVNGTSLCSGRLEVKLNQSNQWYSVCEADFDQQDAEVVCRELGCESPSDLQGGLYGEGEAPVWTKEFQCGGNESALLDCRNSTTTCLSGRAAGLTCSEPVQLVGQLSHCAGTLEVKHQGSWRPAVNTDWTLNEADDVCRELDCGSAVSAGMRWYSSDRPVWWISSDCIQSGYVLRKCVSSDSSSSALEITCSDSVRLVNGTSLCSGRLEVKLDQLDLSNQRWSSVCEADFDQNYAEMVCKELGCGVPSVLWGAASQEFQCGGHESAHLDCKSSESSRTTCSSGKAVGLTCSEPVRLVGEHSRCAGRLEVKQGEWRPVDHSTWTLKEAAVVCRELDCGSVVLTGSRNESSERSVWNIKHDCVQSGSALRECATRSRSSSIIELICSDLLVQPIISVSSVDAAKQQHQGYFTVLEGSSFTISCSIQPQYPGGSFQLLFTSSHTAHNYTQPAVNHSADFLFPAVEPAHQGNYICVYHVYVFSHNFSSESRLLSLTVSDPTVFIIRLVVLLLSLLLFITVMCSVHKTTTGQKPGPQEEADLDYSNTGV